MNRPTLFPVFVNLVTLLCFFSGPQPHPIFQPSLTYVGPPNSAHSTLLTSGIYYYLFVMLTDFASLLAYNLTNWQHDFCDVFFHLTLATWLSAGCRRQVFKAAGKDRHAKSGGAVANGPKGAAIARTTEQGFVHTMANFSRESTGCAPSPWIESHLRKFINQKYQFTDDVHRLLSLVPLSELAYAAEALLSYKLTYPENLVGPYNRRLSVAGELRAVEETHENRIILRQLYPINSPQRS